MVGHSPEEEEERKYAEEVETADTHVGYADYNLEVVRRTVELAVVVDVAPGHRQTGVALPFT